jgi:hypothetical protein
MAADEDLSALLHSANSIAICLLRHTLAEININMNMNMNKPLVWNKHLMGKKSDSALTPHSEQATAPRTPFRIRGSSGTQEFNNHTSDHDHQERPPTLPLSLY